MTDKSLGNQDLPDRERFLLCRPRGGLNDTLCQIEKCWRYAETSGRTLIVDARKSGLLGEFSDFFSPVEVSFPVRFSLSRQLLGTLDGLSCYPGCVRGRLDTYEVCAEGGRCCDTDSRETLTFDFSKEYEEDVLLHDQWGGGDLSFSLLGRVKLANELRPLLLDRLAQLPDEYVALHVRNTDLQTDFEPFFRFVQSKVSGRDLLVCSDDVDVIVRARTFFVSSRVFTISDIPQTGRAPLHLRSTYPDDERRKIATINSIVDLIALGRASEFYYASVARGHASGFSKLAAYLCENSHVIDALLGLGKPAGSGREKGKVHRFVPPVARLRRFARNIVPRSLRPLFNLTRR